jgi:cell division protein FtsI (penicillin-binding protein 3)
MVDRRLIWLAGVVCLWGAAIFYKLISLQVVHHHQYAAEARARQELVVDIPAPRGSIFDRTGSPLAMSVPTESVHVNPLKIPDLTVASEILGMVLHMDRVDLYGRMKNAYDNHRGYLVIKKKVPFEEAQSLRAFRLDWVDIDEESQRHYPNGSLAAHILGGVDFSERGNGGIEKALDQDLRGIAGHERLLTDVKRRGIDSVVASEPKPGVSLTLTIDERLQFVVERELAARALVTKARSGSAVVMNPQTGDILALASWPTYDPNIPPHEGEDPIARANHAVSVPFEPGSVFKVITLSAALETTRLTAASMIDTGRGSITLFGRTIHEAHAGGYGVISMADVLKHSSNVGAVKIGMQVGQEHMYEYVRRFGFGQKTGISLPGEARGRLRPLKIWGKTSLASISIGQEISVTTVQLAQAASVVANGGLLVRPRLILKRGNQAVAPVPPVRVINPETAITMRQIMEGVVLPGGTGWPEARLDGYSVGGKTGTAQVYDFATKHYTHNYNGSFIGFAPLNNPAIVVVVTLNGTHGSNGYGGRASAPVFHTVAQEALRVLDVPKDLPDESPTVVADNQKAPAEDDQDVALVGFSDGPNVLEDPDEDQPAAAPGATANGPTLRAGLLVPDFRGKSMRTVLAEAAAKGLTVLPAGSGVARVQYPPAGSSLHQGERIRVRFAR